MGILCEKRKMFNWRLLGWTSFIFLGQKVKLLGQINWLELICFKIGKYDTKDYFDYIMPHAQGPKGLGLSHIMLHRSHSFLVFFTFAILHIIVYLVIFSWIYFDILTYYLNHLSQSQSYVYFQYCYLGKLLLKLSNK